jgi:hypothetical protein
MHGSQIIFGLTRVVNQIMKEHPQRLVIMKKTRVQSLMTSTDDRNTTQVTGVMLAPVGSEDKVRATFLGLARSCPSTDQSMT